MGFFSLTKSSSRTRSPESSPATTLFKPLWTRSKPIERPRAVTLSTCFEQRFSPAALEEARGRATHADRASPNADIAPLLDVRSVRLHENSRHNYRILDSLIRPSLLQTPSADSLDWDTKQSGRNSSPHSHGSARSVSQDTRCIGLCVDSIPSARAP